MVNDPHNEADQVIRSSDRGEIGGVCWEVNKTAVATDNQVLSTNY